VSSLGRKLQQKARVVTVTEISFFLQVDLGEDALLRWIVPAEIKKR
jgi:hypothetical protein